MQQSSSNSCWPGAKSHVQQAQQLSSTVVHMVCRSQLCEVLGDVLAQQYSCCCRSRCWRVTYGANLLAQLYGKARPGIYVPQGECRVSKLQLCNVCYLQLLIGCSTTPRPAVVMADSMLDSVNCYNYSMMCAEEDMLMDVMDVM